MGKSNGRSGLGLAVLFGLIAVGIGGYWAWLRVGPPSEPMVELPPPAAEVVPSTPIAQYPIDPTPVPDGEPALPELFTSDDSVLAALGKIFGDADWRALLIQQHVIARSVATIDNLPRAKYAINAVPLKSAPGTFLVREDGMQLFIAEANAARYANHLALMDKAESQALVDLYRHLYPLFQQAYVELGDPNVFFNDRLVEVIDHLLAAPMIAAPIEVIQPKAFYEYGEADLESASSGHKILLRMGPENAAKLKAKLSEIRALIVAAPAPAQSAEAASDSKATQQPASPLENAAQAADKQPAVVTPEGGQ